MRERRSDAASAEVAIHQTLNRGSYPQTLIWGHLMRRFFATTLIATSFSSVVSAAEPGKWLSFDYRARYVSTDIRSNDDDIVTPVESTVTTVGSDIDVRITPFFRAYVSLADEFWPDESIFDAEFRESQDPAGAQEGRYIATAIGLAVRPLPNELLAPSFSYERRNISGDYRASRPLTNESGSVVTNSGSVVELYDEQTVLSLQWGDNPRYSGIGRDAFGDLSSESAAQMMLAVDWIQSTALFYEFNAGDATAQLVERDTNSFGYSLVARYNITDEGAPYLFAFGAEIESTLGGDREFFKIGGYLGAYFIPVTDRLSVGATVGAFWTPSDSWQLYGLGGETGFDVGGTIETNFALDATFGASLRF